MSAESIQICCFDLSVKDLIYNNRYTPVQGECIWHANEIQLLNDGFV